MSIAGHLRLRQLESFLLLFCVARCIVPWCPSPRRGLSIVMSVCSSATHFSPRVITSRVGKMSRPTWESHKHVTVSKLGKLRHTRQYEPAANGRGCLTPPLSFPAMAEAAARPADWPAVSNSLRVIADELPHISAALPDARYADMDAKLDRMSMNMEQVLRRLDALGGQFGGMQGQMEGLHGQMEGLQGQVDGLQGQINGLQGQMNGLQGQMNGLRGQVNDVQTEVRTLKTTVADNHDKLTTE